MSAEGRPITMTEEEAAERLGSNLNDLLTREETAAFLRVTTRTLSNWEAQGIGPKCAYVGHRKVVYARQDVESFVERGKAEAAKRKAALQSSPAVQSALQVERARIIAISKATPAGSEAFRDEAINSGMSADAYEAALVEKTVTAIMTAGAFARGER